MNIKVSVVSLLLFFAGCDAQQNVMNSAPAPAPAPAGPDIAAFEELVSTLASNHKTDPMLLNHTLEWSYDVKKSDSLVNPVQGHVTATSSSDSDVTFSYAWKNGEWTPLAVSDPPQARQWLKRFLVHTIYQKKSLPEAFVDLSPLTSEEKSEVRSYRK